ncbi:hypothetical protein MKX03_037039 [Papaver bracteatum]|nr:hypothetical protein MKX03_037039 [Papaver bracteatum]
MVALICSSTSVLSLFQYRFSYLNSIGFVSGEKVYVQKLKINAEETAVEAEKWAELDKEIAAIRIPSESEPLF